MSASASAYARAGAPCSGQAERTSEPARFGFLLTDGFPMIALSAAVEPFRAANEILGRNRYRCTLITEDGAPVRSSSSIQVTPEGDRASMSEMDALFVVGGTSDVRDKSEVFARLRSLARRGAKSAPSAAACFCSPNPVSSTATGAACIGTS